MCACLAWNGLAATRAIRAIERERGAGAVPIIALTAGAWLDDVTLSREAGCTAHLSKPFSLGELMKAVQAHSPRAPQPAAWRDRPEPAPDIHAVDIPELLEA